MSSTEYIVPFIQERLNELTKPPPVCFYEHSIGVDNELKLTLQAAGHDTTELHAAITETLESIDKLKAARDKAIKLFKQQGILFTVVPVVPVVPVAKEEEAPAVLDATEEPVAKEEEAPAGSDATEEPVI
jgi:hypothetical protein